MIIKNSSGGGGGDGNNTISSSLLKNITQKNMLGSFQHIHSTHSMSIIVLLSDD